MNENIILHPTHENYCKTCIYHGEPSCLNEEYNKNAYLVNCVWKRCKYRKEKKNLEK